MLEIVHYPHPALLKPCKNVTTFDQQLKELIVTMFDIMKEHHGIGLAANQLAIDKSLFVMEIDNQQFIFINPTIITTTNEQTLYNEGCLSFPNFGQEVSRSNSITVQWQDLEEKIHQQEFTGLYAICIQHEIDHLNGITFLDHLQPVKKLFATKKFLKNKKLKV